MRTVLMSLALLAALCSPSMADETALVDGADIEVLRDLIAETSPEATVETDDEGRIYIAAIHEGWTYDIRFYDCVGSKNCGIMQYSALFQTNGSFRVEDAIDWHAEWVLGRVSFYRGNAVFEMPVNIAGGVSVANFRDTRDLWHGVLSDFAASLGWQRERPKKN